MPKRKKPSYLDFEKEDYPWKAGVDYRKHPELYRVGKGEQGVLICEPYKSELVAQWHFKTEDIAKESSTKISQMFEEYLSNGEFVGADMARKYLQMGYTRARRYANYKGGKKYDKEQDYEPLERGTGDPEKAKSAKVFFAAWKEAEANASYAEQKAAWKKKHG